MKEVTFDKGKLIKGVKKINSLVSATLGPSGRNILIDGLNEGKPQSTKDGVTVAKSFETEDPVENLGAQFIKEAASKTNELAGDGTTTTTILTSNLIINGFKEIKKGTNAVKVKKELEKGLIKVLNELEKNKLEVSGDEDLKNIALISSNNDKEIGNIVFESIKSAGLEGAVTVEESNTGETYLDIVEGIQFEQGMMSPYFVTDNKTMSSILKDVYVLLVDGKINGINDLLPVLNQVSQENKSLLIVAQDLSQEVMSTLIVNKMKGILKVAAVKTPFGPKRQALLEDIAVVTGGKVISEDKGMTLEDFEVEWLGQAKNVTVEKHTTTIIDGKGDEEKIEERIEDLKSQIDNSKSNFEKEQLQERLSKLLGGVSIIFVGASTETEMLEKKDRVDDALNATKAALQEGILPGGGISLIKTMKVLDKKILGEKLLYEVLYSPLYKMLENAGYDYPEIYGIIKEVQNNREFWNGFDLENNLFKNMKEQGIIDPFKVVKTALKNAVSSAGTMLTTEGIIYNIPEKDDNKMDMNMIGMM